MGGSTVTCGTCGALRGDERCRMEIGPGCRNFNTIHRSPGFPQLSRFLGAPLAGPAFLGYFGSSMFEKIYYLKHQISFDVFTPFLMSWNYSCFMELYPGRLLELPTFLELRELFLMPERKEAICLYLEARELQSSVVGYGLVRCR